MPTEDDFKQLGAGLSEVAASVEPDGVEDAERDPWVSHADYEVEHPDALAYAESEKLAAMRRYAERHGSLEGFVAGREFPCPGMLRVFDRSGAVWGVCCDVCGFEVGVPIAKAAPQLLMERRLERSRIPLDFLAREFVPGPEHSTVLMLMRGYVRDFPKMPVPALALHGEPGRGKALDVSTPILTVNGWREMLDLRAGDYVYGPDGRGRRVCFASEVQLGRECFEVRFSDGSVIVADGDHRWTVSTEAARQSVARRAALAGTQMVLDSRGQAEKWALPVTLTTRELGALVERARKQPSIRCAAPLDRPAAELPIDPYVLGVWLGDGDSRTAMITAHIDDAGFYASQFAIAGETVGPFDADRRRPHVGRFRWGYRPGSRGPNPSGGHARLRALGLMANKHVPESYLRASVSQRLALLQGLVDSDGHVQESGRVEITLTCERLVADVLELARGLGLRATVHESAAMLDGREVGRRWRIQWTSTLRTARLPRKAARLPGVVSTRATHRYVVAVRPVSSRPVKCIEVEAADGLYLAGRELIATHNTHLLAMLSRDLIRRYGADVIYRSAVDLFDELQESFADGSFEVKWERLCTVPVLVLDDLGSERRSEWRDERLAQLIDRRYRACKKSDPAEQRPILLATNIAPNGWAETFGDRPASRLREMARRVQVTGPDRRAGMGVQESLCA